MDHGIPLLRLPAANAKYANWTLSLNRCRPPVLDIGVRVNAGKDLDESGSFCYIIIPLG